MSESENIKRCLDQAAGIAKEHIVVLENDVRCLNYQLSQARKKTKRLEIEFCNEMDQRLSQEIKSETSLMFLFTVACIAAIAISIAILRCQ